MLLEIKPGTQLTFKQDEEELDGIVNGEPYLLFYEDDAEVVARIPVHVPKGNRNFHVAGTNVVSVGA